MTKQEECKHKFSFFMTDKEDEYGRKKKINCIVCHRLLDEIIQDINGEKVE